MHFSAARQSYPHLAKTDKWIFFYLYSIAYVFYCAVKAGNKKYFLVGDFLWISCYTGAQNLLTPARM
jgi:hypothetical protein